MTTDTPTTLLFAGRIAETIKNGTEQITVNTMRPCWLPDPYDEMSESLERLLRTNFQLWASVGPDFRGARGSVNFRVYDTGDGLKMSITAPSKGDLYIEGRARACARVGWWIRENLEGLKQISKAADDKRPREA